MRGQFKSLFSVNVNVYCIQNLNFLTLLKIVMTGNINYTDLRNNSDLFRDLLRQSIDDTVDVSDDFSTKLCKDQSVSMGAKIKKCLGNKLDIAWEQHDLHAKAQFVHQLEVKAPKDSVAWRPTTGEPPILALKYFYLNDKKKRLLNKLTESDKEMESLRKLLMAKAVVTKKHVEMMQEIKKDFKQLSGEYETIVGGTGMKQK